MRESVGRGFGGGVVFFFSPLALRLLLGVPRFYSPYPLPRTRSTGISSPYRPRPAYMLASRLAAWRAAAAAAIAYTCAPPHTLPHAALLAIPLLHWAVAYYIAALHQRGPVAVAEYIATLAEGAAVRGGALPSAHFLTPCHATPLYAILHYPLQALFLDCSPGAVNGGGVGSAPRDRVCEASGCCTEAAPLPALSETGAWAMNKGGVLRALYGDAGLCTVPEPCKVSSNGSSYRSSSGHHHWDTSNSVKPPLPTPGEGAIPPLRFAWEFGSQQCRNAMGAPPPSHSALPCPSHAVLFSGDAAHPEVEKWLTTNGYTAVAAFPMGAVQGDSHAEAEGRGKHDDIMVWKHPCWMNSAGGL